MNLKKIGFKLLIENNTILNQSAMCNEFSSENVLIMLKLINDKRLFRIIPLFKNSIMYVYCFNINSFNIISII